MIGRWGDREFGNWGIGEKRKKPDNPFIELHLPLFDLTDRVKVNHKYQWVSKSGLDLTDSAKSGKNFFLYSSFLKISPPYNISTHNKHIESRILVCYSNRSLFEGELLGKLSTV
ncbi:MAG: hypothetical protein WCO26_22160 [Deltaproteobacteria bacterium]